MNTEVTSTVSTDVVVFYCLFVWIQLAIGNFFIAWWKKKFKANRDYCESFERTFFQALAVVGVALLVLLKAHGIRYFFWTVV